jgi:hypothetical protein
MIRYSRERPFAMFASAGASAAVVGLAFLGGAIAHGVVNDLQPTSRLVLPGSALLILGLSCYLFMLGLLGEVAVQQQREAGPTHDLLSHQETW